MEEKEKMWREQKETGRNILGKRKEDRVRMGKSKNKKEYERDRKIERECETER